MNRTTIFKHLPWVLCVGLGAAWTVRFASVWDRLPDKMASHFDLAGNPDGWMSKSGFAWFDLFFCGGVMLLLLTMPKWLHRMPVEMVNLPNAHYWFAPARAKESAQRMAPWFGWLAVATTVLLLGVNELSVRANLSDGRLPGNRAVQLLVGFLVFLATWVVLFYRSFRVPPPAPNPDPAAPPASPSGTSPASQQ